MALDVKEIVRIVAPEFQNIPDSELDNWVEIFKPYVSKKQFGNLYNQALAYLICHKMKVAGLGEDDGLGSVSDAIRVGSYSEGSRSVSFAGLGTGGSADDEFKLTPYGVQYVTLKRCVVVPITINGSQYA